MDDLVTWLRGVLDERERLADPLDPDDAEMLADIEAKRAILDKVLPILEWADSQSTQEFSADQDAAGEFLRLLASAYRDRPGYRDEWRP